MKTEYQKLQKTILEFAIENHCVINPNGWRVHLDDYLERGYCRCDKARFKCPCDEAPQEIKEKGKCLCGLFWSGYQAYWLAKHFEESLNSVAIVTDTKTTNSGDQAPSKKEDTTKLHSPKHVEALLDFGKGSEESTKSSTDYIAEAISLLTGKAGISLEGSRRVTIFKDDEGAICVDIVPPQDEAEPEKKYGQEFESVIDDVIQRSLLQMISDDGTTDGDILRVMISQRYGTELLWEQTFNSWLRSLEKGGDVVRDRNGLWHITDAGRQRLLPRRSKG